jgi:hypothetical protein
MHRMNTSTMTQVHGSPKPGLLPLGHGQVTRLAAARDARLLWVQQGRVWATRTTANHAARGQAEDQWLAAGQTLALPAGSEWVIEPWPAAQVALMLAMPSPASAS